MIRLTSRFVTREEGAIRLDWIVLVAGAVALSLGAASMILDRDTEHSATPSTATEGPAGD